MRFVGIRCNCSRQESAMLLSHTLADPEIPCKEVSIFFYLCEVFRDIIWCICSRRKVSSFYIQAVCVPFVNTTSRLPFPLVFSFCLHLVLIGRIYIRLSNDLILCGTNICYFGGGCCLLVFLRNPCLFLRNVLSPLSLR